MNLKSGCVYWPQLHHRNAPHYSPLDADISCDVAIVGGGISGALAAYHLTAEGVRTVLVDARQVAAGSTSASTGLLQYEIDTPLVELVESVGAEYAARVYRASFAALRAFEPLVADLGDSCGLVPRHSLYLASRADDVPLLRAECEARRKIGIDVDFWDAPTLARRSSVARPGGLWSPTAFEIDPYRLTSRLVARSIGRGLRAFGDTRVMDYEPRPGGVALTTAGGPRITARRVIFATGYDLPALPPRVRHALPRDFCKLRSTYAFVSEPLRETPGWPDHCLMWESARPYCYLRSTQDGRAMIGGEDEDFADPARRDALLPRKTRTLAAKFAALFPDIPMTPACAWAGTFAETPDGLPYIGSLPQVPHASFVFGYGGNGITFSLLAAQIIRDDFLGRANGDGELFGFNR